MIFPQFQGKEILILVKKLCKLCNTLVEAFYELSSFQVKDFGEIGRFQNPCI